MRYRADGCHVVVGLGSAGSRHLSILADLGIPDLAVVRSHRGPTSRPTPPGIVECASVEAALALDPVVAVVATPTSLHADSAGAFLDAGVPVLVEKPLTDSLTSALALQDSARHTGVPVKAAYHLQFHPGLSWLRALIASGSLGRPVGLRATWGEYLPDWHPDEDYTIGYAARSELGGGPILTLSHVVDYAVTLLGPVHSVTSRGRTASTLGLDVPDAVSFTMTHDEGAVSDIELDFVTRPPVHHVELRCTDGRAEWDVLRRTATCLPASGTALAPVPDLSASTREQCFVDQMSWFLASLEAGTDVDMTHDAAVSSALQAVTDATDADRR